jgi:hypothetical protein
MTILSTLIWNLLAPAIVSGTLVALARRLARAGWKARWGVSAGLGLGYFVGHWGILGWPPFLTLDAKSIVAWVVLAAALLGMIESGQSSSGRVVWAIRGIFLAGLLLWVLRTQLDNAWAPVEAAAWMGGIWLVLLASWWNLESNAERIPGPGWMFHLGIISGGWAAVQVISGNASCGQLEGVLASTALGALPVVGLRPGLALSRGGSAVAITVLAGLGLTGYFYSEVPAVSAILLTLAPWAPWIDRIGLIRRRSPWTRAAVRGLAVLLVVGAGVLVAVAGSSRALEDGSSL